MSKLAQEDATTLYVGLMEEIKLRKMVVDKMMGGKLPMLQAFGTEFCYLQFRMICEGIALACLTAHGDSPGLLGGKMRKEYSADKILAKLEGLNPLFYPAPVTCTWNAKTGSLDVRPIENGFLTKDDLSDLVGKCGSVLHRGGYNKLARGTLLDAWFAEIPQWRKKINALLAVHMFPSLDETRLFICDLGDEKRDIELATCKMRPPQRSSS